MSKNKTSVLLLCASIGVTLALLVALGWFLSVSSFGMLTSSESPNLMPDPSYVSFAERYAEFLAVIARDVWLLVPLLMAGLMAWLQWRRDRLFSVAIIMLGCNLLLVYHVVFVVLNSSMKK